MTTRTTPELSVVIPLFNESANVSSLFERLFAVLEALDTTFEVIAVDDGSTDDTFDLLADEADTRRELVVLPLARNFGQHPAIVAGFDHARGDFVITLDADLQNPPEDIPLILAKLRQGHDLVNTVRQGRQDSGFRMAASKLNGWLTRRLSGIELKDFGSMIRGYRRDLVQAMTAQKQFGSFIPALAALHSRNPVEIAVGHAPRAEGSSRYSILRLLGLHLDLTTTFSLVPLRALFTLGAIIAALSIAFGVLLIVLRFAYGATWAGEGVFSLFAVLFFLIGAQFVAFGLIGEYVGRIYQEIRRRPAYLLRDSPLSSERSAPAPSKRRHSSEARRAGVETRQ